jgi:regulator of protease activity HflC (stomatin/prohibitin superfamily)
MTSLIDTDEYFDDDIAVVKAKGVSAVSMTHRQGQTVTTRSLRNTPNPDHFRADYSNDEDSPSYDALVSHGLLCKSYRVDSEKDLALIPSNSTPWINVLIGTVCCPLTCFGCFKTFTVPNACLKRGTDGRGNYLYYGPGVHRILDPWYSFEAGHENFAKGSIPHGDRTIVTVPQGFIGYCTERGQPVLLPPGMHQWRSSVLQFVNFIDLTDAVIPLGPWTLLTIDQGYMAVTQDNGQQVILDGGSVYLLTHRNWKFERFISTKIQTNELTRIEAASADNVVMLVDATVLWFIDDVETAVRMSAETMDADGSKSNDSSDIVKLRNDVLKQAEASLAFFIGTINFSDTMAAAAIHQRRQDIATDALLLPSYEPQHDNNGEKVFNLYNNEKLHDAVAHANKNTETYGVVIKSINIISAIPKDKNLQASLAAGAVAAAEAQMMETTAQGKARAIEIEATANAKKTMIIAQAEADADVLRAEGSKAAADLLATNPVSVDLAKIQRTGDALAGKGNHATFFFGADSNHLGALLSNQGIVSGNPGRGSTNQRGTLL